MVQMQYSQLCNYLVQYITRLMEKILFLFVVYSFISLKCIGQDFHVSTCKCQYYSSYNLKTYINKIDSIRKVISKNYGNVALIGYRSFSAANVLFISKGKGGYKGFFYNLIKKSNQVIKSPKVKEMANRILNDTSAIKNSDTIKPQYISHDFSFFVSYRGGKSIYEVCYSQVLTVRNKKIGQLFIYYLDNY